MAPPLRLLLVLPCAIAIVAAAVRNSEAGEIHLWNYCPTDTNYTANSTFQVNLNLLLPALSSGAASTGYYNGTEGLSVREQAYGLALCRGDVSSDECRSCLDVATQDIVRECPHGKRSTVSYDNCLLRYSNQSFFGTADTSFWYYAWNPSNASDQLTFDTVLGNLMKDLISIATRSTPKLFAAKSVNATAFSNLYGLVQCTRDLSANDCYNCLQNALGRIPQCCEGKQGGKVYGQSCYLRFESYLFYNTSAVDLAPAPPASPPPPPPPPITTKDGNNTSPNAGSGGSSNILVLAVAIPASLAVVLVILIGTFMCLRKKKISQTSLTVSEDNKDVQSLLYDMSSLRSATNDFSEENKLGEGGFGPVYKGTLPDGSQIAVKRLSRGSTQGIIEMKTEVVLVAKLQHKNLVRLLGCCLEGEEKLLVYEYLPNKSLDTFLFDPIGRMKLDWGTRHKIIQGIGRGLVYLHEDSRLKIIHRDLKASNILLDGDMNPKISDFGLAKLFDMDETHGRTKRIAGTVGYMAPEYAIHGHFSTKSDVFSFGVLVLEIITGRRNNSYQGSGPSVDVVSFVWQQWRQGTTLDVIDPTLVDRCPAQEVQRCVHVGLLCVQEDVEERPSMGAVILMLSSDYSITLQAPSAPAFRMDSSGRESDVGNGSGLSSEKRYNNAKGVSINDVTISELRPR